jgi:hypothetical protein
MSQAKVMLLTSDKQFKVLLVGYAVNPIGSDRLYRLTSVVGKKSGRVYLLDEIEGLNPPKAIDAQIAEAIHGPYRKHQEIPKKKTVKKKPSKEPTLL